MSNIQIRIDEKEKQAAKKILDNIGLDMSTAIKLFLKRVTINKGIPFLLMTENNLSVEQEDAIIRASKEAKQGENISNKINNKEAMAYLDTL